MLYVRTCTHIVWCKCSSFAGAEAPPQAPFEQCQDCRRRRRCDRHSSHPTVLGACLCAPTAAAGAGGPFHRLAKRAQICANLHLDALRHAPCARLVASAALTG
eukprot:6210176-Pleurochrysis_carterae.AAC.3